MTSSAITVSATPDYQGATFEHDKKVIVQEVRKYLSTNGIAEIVADYVTSKETSIFGPKEWAFYFGGRFDGPEFPPANDPLTHEPIGPTTHLPPVYLPLMKLALPGSASTSKWTVTRLGNNS